MRKPTKPAPIQAPPAASGHKCRHQPFASDNMTYPEQKIQRYIAVFGNPIDGLCFVGPFPTRNLAGLYCVNAERGPFFGDWWITELEAAPLEFQDGNNES